MILIKWTEAARGSLEARFWCKHCGKSNFVTANKNPAFFTANPNWTSTPCGNCGAIATLKKTSAGLEVK